GDDRSATPTIILLPFGRMLVVDRTVITQLQADQTGIDFMELSANLIRAHHLRYSSTPSILDSDTTSKGLSPISLGYSPPSYEDIFGEKTNDLPPSYSELSLLFRQRQMEYSEMQDFNLGSVAVVRNEETVRETVLDITEGGNEEETNNSAQEVDARQEVGNSEQVAIIVPSNLQDTNLHSDVDTVSAANEEFTYPNCKYCIMSLGTDRRAKIKCYCFQSSLEKKNKCALMTRSYDDSASSSTTQVEIENNSCECPVYTAESIPTDRETFLESDNVKNGNELSGINKYGNKCAFNDRHSHEGTCKLSCEDIRESSL
ncbi:hypothetical protein AMK59_2503, partial [Oryctes borbonicus]